MNNMQATVKLLLLPAALLLVACASPAGVSFDASVWNINSLSRIGGAPAEVL